MLDRFGHRHNFHVRVSISNTGYRQYRLIEPSCGPKMSFHDLSFLEKFELQSGEVIGIFRDGIDQLIIDCNSDRVSVTPAAVKAALARSPTELVLGTAAGTGGGGLGRGNEPAPCPTKAVAGRALSNAVTGTAGRAAPGSGAGRGSNPVPGSVNAAALPGAVVGRAPGGGGGGGGAGAGRGSESTPRPTKAAAGRLLLSAVAQTAGAVGGGGTGRESIPGPLPAKTAAEGAPLGTVERSGTAARGRTCGGGAGGDDGGNAKAGRKGVEDAIGPAPHLAALMRSGRASKRCRPRDIVF